MLFYLRFHKKPYSKTKKLEKYIWNNFQIKYYQQKIGIAMSLLFYFSLIQQIKKNEIIFDNNKTVQILRKRFSSLKGFITPFFSNQQNEQVDLLQDKSEIDQIKAIKESVKQKQTLIEEIISSKNKIQSSSDENKQAFKNLEKSFEQFAEDLGEQQSEEQFKKTLNMFSNNFQRTSNNFQEINTESDKGLKLLNFLLEDVKEIKSSIQNFLEYRDKIDNTTQQQYQVNQQSTEETVQEYKLKLETFIQNLKEADKSTSQDKKQIMETDLNKLTKFLFKIQDEWQD